MAISATIPFVSRSIFLILFLPLYLTLSLILAVFATASSLASLSILGLRLFLIYSELTLGISLNFLREAFAALLSAFASICAQLAGKWRGPLLETPSPSPIPTPLQQSPDDPHAFSPAYRRINHLGSNGLEKETSYFSLQRPTTHG